MSFCVKIHYHEIGWLQTCYLAICSYLPTKFALMLFVWKVNLSSIFLLQTCKYCYLQIKGDSKKLDTINSQYIAIVCTAQYSIACLLSMRYRPRLDMYVENGSYIHITLMPGILLWQLKLIGTASTGCSNLL